MKSKPNRRRLLSQLAAASTITIDVAACIRQTGIAIALIILAVQAPELGIGAMLGQAVSGALKRVPP